MTVSYSTPLHNKSRGLALGASPWAGTDAVCVGFEMTRGWEPAPLIGGVAQVWMP